MKKILLWIVFFVVSGVCVGFAGDCDQGYPHVAKKNGTFDARQNDLWEIAQDWVHYRNKILICNRKGDQKGAEQARVQFQGANRSLSDYRDSQSSEAVALAEDCWLKNH